MSRMARKTIGRKRERKNMTDKEILEEVHRKLWRPFDCEAGKYWRNTDHKGLFDRLHDIKDFIELEWQRADEQELVDQYNRNREVKDQVSSLGQVTDDWFGSDPCTTDAKEIERHRGLEIAEDGTVKGLK